MEVNGRLHAMVALLPEEKNYPLFRRLGKTL
jgi:hypothetical protein